jgi:hypothetical protein
MEKSNVYFIDDNIWYQGVLQPPKKIYCYLLDIKYGIAHFYDKDGNSYLLPEERIIYEM